jgi:5-methylcytosine-specific restriction endonuclease McrA
LRSNVAYDPTAKNGLRWIGPQKKGPKRNELAKTFWVGSYSYQAPQVVLVLNGILPERDDQIAARIDPFGSWADISNLCWGDRGESMQASREARRIRIVRAEIGEDIPNLGDRHRLGQLCNKKHLWNGFRLTLQVRQGRTWKCEKCISEYNQSEKGKKSRIERGKRNYYRHLEKKREAARARMAAKREDTAEHERIKERNRQNAVARRTRLGRDTRAKGLEGMMLPPGRTLSIPEARAARELVASGVPLDWKEIEPLLAPQLELHQLWDVAIRRAGRFPSVADLVEAERRRYLREHPEIRREADRIKRKEYHRRRYLADPNYRLYNRQKSKRRKAQMRDSVAIQLTGQQVRARFAQFDHCCAYCGAGGELHIEHVVPIAKGGTHAMGNIVPACKRCNYSKTAHEVESWYKSQPFFSELRWRKICRVLGWNRSAVGQLALL